MQLFTSGSLCFFRDWSNNDEIISDIFLIPSHVLSVKSKHRFIDLRKNKIKHRVCGCQYIPFVGSLFVLKGCLHEM